MAPRLAAVPFLALAFGAVDTLLVRAEQGHRPLDASLFWQTVLLWLCYALVALIPAAGLPALAARRRRRRGMAAPQPGPRATASAIAGLAAWTAGPVVLHSRVNRYTHVGGDLSGLLDFAPWLDVGLTLALLVAATFGLRVVIERVGPRVLGAGLGLASLALGLAVSFHESPAAGIARGELEGDVERPNVLLLIWDTTRARSFSLYGYPRETTPSIDELARDSILYERARSASRYTLTSHLSMLTGVYPSHHGARLTRQVYDPHETPPVVHDFARAGYRTAAFVGTGVLRARTGTAFAFDVYDDRVDPWVCDTRGWSLLHDLQAVLGKAVPALHNNGLPHWIQDFQRPAPGVLERAAAWIAAPDPRPWFCMVNLYDAHWPYVPGAQSRELWVEPYDGTVDGYLRRSDKYVKGAASDADKKHVRELYDAEIWELDRRVAAFLEALELDDTALVVTSDHGEAFGERGRWEHDDILESQVRVPLLVRPAGGVAPRRVSEPASGVDVAPTLLALAGLEVEAGRFAGANLLERLDAERLVLVEDRDHLDPLDVRLALYDGRWKLVRQGIGTDVSWALYDLEVDPRGIEDVALENREVLRGLRAKLDGLRASWGADDLEDLEGLLEGGALNEAALKALGYIE